MQWEIGVAEVIGGLVLLVVLTLLLLTLRRRWVARPGGTFECSLRLNPAAANTGWVLGVGRYSGDNLEWFRFFSYSARPRLTFARSAVRVGESREPDAREAVALYSGQRVVALDIDGDRRWELAMSDASLTGMLSWLEAAPPGVSHP